ncbi:N-acetyltransferase GCN5 [Capsulimonas corticalis]|uniref:N-acetyltransferase GCN5 n=1 Tax=Capsulimonas corticalis TaxID=2219043 RepID=A0A402D0Q5_9BACT|nr:GNAT family N-acetyltransferase [Capsulimonas corticalis]BDI33584.1 N-acetyltransferase GCN5 [Capsulimonas corticalis]
MITSPQVEMRPATPEDDEFLYTVYASTREQELLAAPWDNEQKASFLRMQFQAQHTYYHAQFPDARYDVLIRDGEAIGRLYTDRRKDELKILDIALLPQHCGKGVGTQLIRMFMDEATALGLPVRLHVETFNRAQRLYARLGFTQVQNDGIYILMEWNPTNGHQ